MDARTHEAIAIATFKDMPESFKEGAFGRALTRLQPEEWHLWHGALSNIVHSKSEEDIGDFIDTLLNQTKKATPGKFSQGNMFREIARRSEKFYLKWLPFAVETAKSGDNIAEKPKTVEMIQDVKDNLATIWHFIDAHMAKDLKMAKIAKNYGIPTSKPVPKKILNKMTAGEKEYFI